MNIELLLAHADDQQPALGSGLPPDSIADPAPRADLLQPTQFFDPGGDPNSLPLQRWGVVAPEGPAGDRLLALVEPLRQARQAEQGGWPTPVYRVPPRIGAVGASEWKSRVFRDESMAEEDLPRYLLFLGDLDQVSLELQQAMASDCYTGRLAFPNEEGLEAYVDKVLRWERHPARRQNVRTLFYSAHDGTAATHIGYQRLVRPSVELCRQRQALGSFPSRELAEIGNASNWSPDLLLSEAAVSQTSVLFTLSHGAGAPRAGWSSPERQRALQGAMCLGSGKCLTAADLANRPFLPGGIWFYMACYGAGTPSRSAYYHWLYRLKESQQFAGRLDSVVAGLPREGERPFIASLPQAVLSNPNGPLAVMGHVDLAWTYSFSEQNGRSHPSRFASVLRALVDGCRAGVGIHALTRFALEANVELTTLYDRDEAARHSKLASTEEAVHRGHLWMLLHDLSGYILLGDPAVRLPLLSEAQEAGREPPASSPEALAARVLERYPSAAEKAPSVDTIEEAVLALLAGERAAKDIAARQGVSLSVLRAWEAAYRSGGRSALQRQETKGAPVDPETSRL